MLFGSKKPQSKTTLVLDVESGSVGSSLVRTSPNEPPKLFGESRVHIRTPHARDSHSLLQSIVRAAGDAIAHTSEVAARLRLHPKAHDTGVINKSALFLSAPWGVPDLKEGKPTFMESMVRPLRGLLNSHVGDAPYTLHTHAGALVRGMQALLDTKSPILLCSVHGEVVELTLLERGKVLGHATMPLGVNSLIRTLKTHGAASEHEARSVLRLGGAKRYEEPLRSSAEHFRELFREAGEPLFAGVPVEAVYVFSRGLEAPWFAQSLSHESLADLFPKGGRVSALGAQHFTPFIAAHKEDPDASLLLHALFID